MTKSVFVVLTGDLPKKLISNRTGKEFQILDIYVKADAPFPEKVPVFENPNLPKGAYNVPYKLQVNNGRLEVRLDFSSASPAESK